MRIVVKFIYDFQGITFLFSRVLIFRYAPDQRIDKTLYVRWQLTFKFQVSPGHGVIESDQTRVKGLARKGSERLCGLVGKPG